MKTKDQARNIEILLVEDNPGDVLLTREALNEARLFNTIHIVNDGVQALDYLFQRGAYLDAAHPDLILLDLNLPRKNGIEVLAEIKATPALKLIPVVVLTTSSAEEDILKTYDLHANSYVVKPVGFDNFIKAVQSINHFWFSVVTLPPER
jgi:two-component system, chemotaxis family, response regulator Rcp1